jgi:hypothetical protein
MVQMHYVDVASLGQTAQAQRPGESTQNRQETMERSPS